MAYYSSLRKKNNKSRLTRNAPVQAGNSPPPFLLPTPSRSEGLTVVFLASLFSLLLFLPLLVLLAFVPCLLIFHPCRSLHPCKFFFALPHPS